MWKSFKKISLKYEKKIIGALWNLPSKPSKRLLDFVFCFDILIFIYFLKYETIETHARAFIPLNISAVGSVTPLVPYGYRPELSEK